MEKRPPGDVTWKRDLRDTLSVELGYLLVNIHGHGAYKLEPAEHRPTDRSYRYYQVNSESDETFDFAFCIATSAEHVTNGHRLGHVGLHLSAINFLRYY